MSLNYLPRLPVDTPPYCGKQADQKTVFQNLAEKLPSVLYRFISNPPKGFEYINPAAADITGYTQEEFYGNPDLLFRLVHPVDRNIVQRLLAGFEVDQPVLVRWIQKDGSLVWVEQHIVPVYDQEGRVIGLEGIARPLSTANGAGLGDSAASPKRRLLEISQSLASSLTSEEIMGHILQAVIDLVPSNQYTFWIKKEYPEANQLLKNARYLAPAGRITVEVLKPWDPNELIELTQCSANGSVPAILGFQDEDEVLPQEHKMVLPIHSQEHRLIGIAHLNRTSTLAFSAEEYRMAEMCMDYISLLLENTRLCHENRSRIEQLAYIAPLHECLNHPLNMSEVSQAIGNGALAISGADRVGVFQHNPDLTLSHLWSQGLSSDYLRRVTSQRYPLFENQFLQGHIPHLVPQIKKLPPGSLARQLAELEGYQALALLPLVSNQNIVASVDCYFNQPQSWSADDREAFELFSYQAAVAMENTRLYEELEETYLETVLTLAKAIDIRDAYTANHSRRLADWAEATARRFDCTPEEIKMIRWAALLHDIGKIGVPDSILRKPGPLTEDEWVIMRKHPVLGEEIVSPVKRLKPVTEIIRSHQEKYDGSGYPDGLRGEQIPLPARILTVIDAFGAMTDDRVFRKARSKEDAAAELRRCAGTHFDEQVVNIFFDVIDSPLAL